MRVISYFFITLVCLVSCGACNNGSVSLYPLTITTSDEVVSFHVELADTDAKRQEGLMNRTELATDRGMLFTWTADTQGSFWMRNTYIPLDIIFINSNRQIVSISANTTPLSDDLITSDVPYRYVLEINAGQSLDLGIEVGNEVNFDL